MATYSVKLVNGAKMPLIGLGTWQADDEASVKNVVHEAIKDGYRHIDTAYLYKNEKAIGDALQVAFKEGIVKREDMFIVTKLPGFGHRPDKLKDVFMTSLKKLQLAYVDLYLIHFPIPLKGDDEKSFVTDDKGNALYDDCDMLETWQVMEKLVDEGLVKAIGLSNYNSEQIKKIYDASRIKPANLQVECNVYFQQEKLFNFCRSLGITFTAYAPIGSPAFSAFVKKEYGLDVPPPPSPFEDPVITAIAKRYDKTPAQICLRFLVQRGIIVIPKSSSPQRLSENFQIFDFQLSEEEMNDLKKLDTNQRQFQLKMGGFEHHPNFPYNIPF